MHPSTTIREMIVGKKIEVPSFQRAYSWDTPSESSQRNTQVDIFLSDLEEYRKSNAQSPYYFGHFLFEESNGKLRVIDGQQRLTTIVIFLSAIFTRLKTFNTKLTENEDSLFRSIKFFAFATVDYDQQLFIDYVIEQTKTNHNGLETESALRIVRAFDFFKTKLFKMDEDHLKELVTIVSEATSTTHKIKDESEAIQMFIFQNNRGKRPSNLEIVKAQFMYHIHLYGKDETESLIDEIKNRFEKIYKSISSIEYKINEDDVLTYTLKVHFNSLWEVYSQNKITKILSEGQSLIFIREFTRCLTESFEYLSLFCNKEKQKHFAIYSLIQLGNIGFALPFIIKAYKYSLQADHINKLCISLESLILRHRLIGTRADMASRLNTSFAEFQFNTKDIQPIICLIESMKTSSDYWWAHWNNENLNQSIQGKLKHDVAKFLLWKYEVHLGSQGKSGYAAPRFDDIEKPELEHIAPSTEPAIKPHGYNEYDDDFKEQYIDCLGNYLLLSKSHNCAVGNIPFNQKVETYNHNNQQREVREMASKKPIWDKEMIQKRKVKIIESLMLYV